MTTDGDVDTVHPGSDTGPARRHRRNEAAVSAALVTALVVVHLLMAQQVATLPDAVFDALDGVLGVQLSVLFLHVLPGLPLAVVLLFWARERSLGVIAAAVVLGEGVLVHLRGVVLERMLDAGHLDAALRLLDVTQWVILVLVPVAVVLAWGLARRRGRAWLPGLLVAGAVAVPFRSIDAAAVGLSGGSAAMLYALVLHVVPAVLGGVVCWWLEVRRTQA